MHLENTNKSLREVVEVAALYGPVREVEFSSKHLHAQEREDNNEEEEEEEEGGNGTDWVDQRGHEAAQRCPVPGTQKQTAGTLDMN